jgi:uncharacterized membrane protein YdjX (TVP38/TMEM64 family)
VLNRPALASKSAASAAVALSLLVLAAGVCAAWLFASDAPRWAALDGDWWAQCWERCWARLSAWRAESPWAFLAAFMLLFTLLAALALPGCAPLALFAGSAYGTLMGSLLVGLASTLGATLSFLAARHWLRQSAQRHLGHRLEGVEQAIARHGRMGVFWLRLLPLVPFPLLNPLLGLSRMPLASFFWPSLLGLTLGSIPYVWAGGKLLVWWQDGRVDVWALAGAASLLLAAAWWLRRTRARALAGMPR